MESRPEWSGNEARIAWDQGQNGIGMRSEQPGNEARKARDQGQNSVTVLQAMRLPTYHIIHQYWCILLLARIQTY